MKNNLFSYATSELSQDAFLCWLCSFALEGARPNRVLQKCAYAMLELFVPDFESKNVKLEEIARQKDNIDILFTAWCDGKMYKIIFEDKVYSGEHDDQLNRYREKITKKYPSCEVRGVYYIMGFESNLDSVRDKGYQVVRRKSVLALLKQYAEKADNDILRDYYEYWADCQQQAEGYRTMPVNEWGWQQVYAFFDELHSNPQENAWSSFQYVSNPSGGFECLAFGDKSDQIVVGGVPCALYMHLEFYGNERVKDSQLKITLKLEITKSGKELEGAGLSFAEVRNRVICDESGNYALGHYHFERPHRLRSGKYMTLGIYNGDCLTAENCQKTLRAVLEDYRRILGNIREKT